MTEHRWSKFWWQDHNDDAALKMVSFAAQGLWVRLLGEMHKSEREGYLLINGIIPTVTQIARVVGGAEREVAKLLAELEQARVFSREDDGTIYSRRMVRDKARRDKARVDGATGGNPTLKAKDKGDGYPGGLTPPLNLHARALEAEADTEAEYIPPSSPLTPASPLAPPTRDKAMGSRLPPGWQPTPEGDGLAETLGLDRNRVLASFRDYWAAQPGQRGRKADWDATWRNWCRREAERPRAPPGKTSHMSTHDQNDALVRLAREPEMPLMRLAQ